MRGTQFADISDYERIRDPTECVPAAARRLGEYYGSIVQAATAAWYREVPIVSAIRCRRRPDRRRCPGHVGIRVRDDDKPIDWSCIECLDDGLIYYWSGCLWDLSNVEVSGAREPGAWAVATIDEEAYRLLLVDTVPEQRPGYSLE